MEFVNNFLLYNFTIERAWKESQFLRYVFCERSLTCVFICIFFAWCFVWILKKPSYFYLFEFNCRPSRKSGSLRASIDVLEFAQKIFVITLILPTYFGGNLRSKFRIRGKRRANLQELSEIWENFQKYTFLYKIG